MRRVLMLSPHFPPDSSAATHRVRLLAPHLPAHGWQPTVVAADAGSYEGPLDPGLAELVPAALRVVRYCAWSPRWTRGMGIGDLGLRSLVPAWRAATSLLDREPVDVVFITTYPIYTAALGPMLKRRYGVPYVIDLQDPWVGAWGRTVGGGADGRPDTKSRLSRLVAARLERPVLGGASAITAVSARTYTDVFARWPSLAGRPCAAIPIGVEPHDFEQASVRRSGPPLFDGQDGLVHVCAVGTVLPTGVAVLRTLLGALAGLRRQCPRAVARLRLHFVGTSNERSAAAAVRVLPLAKQAGVEDLVSEHATRVDYLEAARLLQDAQAVLLLGSTEPHYTASRLYPALAVRRQIVAVYHEASSVVEILRRHTRPPTVRLVAFNGQDALAASAEAIGDALRGLADGSGYNATDVSDAAIDAYSARTLAGELASVLERVA
jgi:glycosyltransferase involved in cell wall biosynthesis